MRLLTLARLQAYAAVVAAYDEAEAAGDGEEATALYAGPWHDAATRLPVKVRAWLDDVLPRPCTTEGCGCKPAHVEVGPE